LILSKKNLVTFPLFSVTRPTMYKRFPTYTFHGAGYYESKHAPVPVRKVLKDLSMLALTCNFKNMNEFFQIINHDLHPDQNTLRSKSDQELIKNVHTSVQQLTRQPDLFTLPPDGALTLVITALGEINKILQDNNPHLFQCTRTTTLKNGMTLAFLDLFVNEFLCRVYPKEIMNSYKATLDDLMRSCLHIKCRLCLLEFQRHLEYLVFLPMITPLNGVNHYVIFTPYQQVECHHPIPKQPNSTELDVIMEYIGDAQLQQFYSYFDFIKPSDIICYPLSRQLCLCNLDAQSVVQFVMARFVNVCKAQFDRKNVNQVQFNQISSHVLPGPLMSLEDAIMQLNNTSATTTSQIMLGLFAGTSTIKTSPRKRNSPKVLFQTPSVLSICTNKISSTPQISLQTESGLSISISPNQGSPTKRNSPQVTYPKKKRKQYTKKSLSNKTNPTKAKKPSTKKSKKLKKTTTKTKKTSTTSKKPRNKLIGSPDGCFFRVIKETTEGEIQAVEDFIVHDQWTLRNKITSFVNHRWKKPGVNQLVSAKTGQSKQWRDVLVTQEPSHWRKKQITDTNAHDYGSVYYIFDSHMKKDPTSA
jgi:hypothetical protein